MQISDKSRGPLESGGVEGELSLWLAGSISRTRRVVYIVMGEFYIVNSKWLPEGEDIVRKWGEWRGSVYLVAIFPSLLDKTEGHRGAI